MSARRRKEWNPRYVAYAKAHGKVPAAMLKHDRKRWPGGLMAGFVIWIDERWREWAGVVGRKTLDGLSQDDHERFDEWLTQKVA